MKRPPDPTGDFTETPISTRLAYDGGFLKLRRDEVRLPGGAAAWREYVEHPGAVVMMAFLDDDTILFERQYRYPLRRHFIELPAGKLEAGEPPLATARRELVEECGYEAADWRHLMTLHPCIGYSDRGHRDLFGARPHPRRRPPGRGRAPRGLPGPHRRRPGLGPGGPDLGHEDHHWPFVVVPVRPDEGKVAGIPGRSPEERE